MRRTLSVLLLLLALFTGVAAQQAVLSVSERGSHTAKQGFRNEDEIRDKFNSWQKDDDARAWLLAMGIDPAEVAAVKAFKPHGDKADVVVQIRKADGSEIREGISIKLVSGRTGFNQVDKRWLRQYVKMWYIPGDVASALRLFLGEDKPSISSRRPDRMFLTELDDESQKQVVEFFTANKERIVADLLRGEGLNKADRLMVAWKPGGEKRWLIVPVENAIRFYAEGSVEITRNGNLRIGRITMQRKGGDGGRETAKMLQFKLNPTLLFAMN